jgi:hypothetical protein
MRRERAGAQDLALHVEIEVLNVWWVQRWICIEELPPSL